MNTRFELKIFLGFLFILCLIVGVGIYTFKSNQRQLEASRWINHTNEVLYHSEHLLSTVIDLETGQRGYALSGKKEFLVPYFVAKDSLEKRLQLLFLLTNNNPRQHARIITLQNLIQQKITWSNMAIEARDQSVEKVITLVSTLKGKKIMDQLRNTLTSFQQEEMSMMKIRVLENEKQIAKFNLTFVLTITLTTVILSTLLYMIYINLKARKKAEDALEKAFLEIKDLYDNAPCGYHSLNPDGTIISMNNTLLKWLGYEKEEIVNQKKIYDLITPESLVKAKNGFSRFKTEGFIDSVDFDFVRKDGTFLACILSSSAVLDEDGHYLRSRSTTFDNTIQKVANEKIRLLNQELEAFTYSVSHDLRSPLRSISGYTLILEEEYSNRLDEEGKRVLGVIVKNARRMAHLIDDLLNFSHIGRKDFSHCYIDMDKLLNNILQEMTEQNASDKKKDIRVLPLHYCYGDISMIRQVWINLISNALKYAQHKECIEIQIGSYQDNKETTYYIKDNGAGFDMKYVDKLFGVFQRLHKINEFEGTGVGLALVKRIINRHGGRVSAESKVNEGATFSFSLPHQL